MAKYRDWIDRWFACMDGKDGVNLFLALGMLPIAFIGIVFDHFDIRY